MTFFRIQVKSQRICNLQMDNLENYLTDNEKIISLGIKDKIIFCLGVNASEIPPEASLTHDLGGDSLEIMDLFMEIEVATGLAISAVIQDDSALYQHGFKKAINTVQDLQKLLNSLGNNLPPT